MSKQKKSDMPVAAATTCSASLANDVARCNGVGFQEDEGWDWREGCETCLRRTAAHAAPFVEEAFQIAFALTEPGKAKTASNGVYVICQGHDFICKRQNSNDYHYGGSRDDAVSKSSFQLALAIARA